MNTRQRAVIIAGMALVALMSLFPPWEQLTRGGAIDAGYAPVWREERYYSVNLGRLALQYAAVAFQAVGACYVLQERKPHKSGLVARK